MIERVVINPDIATILIKEGWELGYIRPNAKKGYEGKAVFIFNVKDADDEKFDNRLILLKEESRERKDKERLERYKQAESKNEIVKEVAVNNINTNFDIDMLILELSKVADAMVKDLNRNINTKIDGLIKAVKDINSVDLDKIEINADDIGDVGRKILEARKSK